jgi:CHAT domain-containing protein
MLRLLSSLMVSLQLFVLSPLNAQIRPPATPLEKLAFDNAQNMTVDPIGSCRILDSIYRVTRGNPIYTQDSVFEQLVKNGRIGACFNAIKPLSEIDQGPYTVINHCLQVKRMLYESEKDTATLIQSLLYLNGILALNYERNLEYSMVIDLKKEFDPFRNRIDREFYFEYVKFLMTLLTSYKELGRFEEGFDVALSSHFYLEEVLKNSNNLPAELESNIKGINLSLLNHIGQLKEEEGEPVLARFFYEKCRDKAIEWDMIRLEFFISYVSFLGRIGAYEEQDSTLIQLEALVRTKFGVRSKEYISVLMDKAMLQLDLGNYLKAKQITEQAIGISVEMDLPFFITQSIREMMIVILEEIGEAKELETVYQSLIDDHKAYYGKSPTLIRLLTGYGLCRKIPKDKRVRVLTEAENLAMEYKDTLALLDIYAKIHLLTTDLYLEAKYSGLEYNKPETLLRELTQRMLLCLQSPQLANAQKQAYYKSLIASTHTLLNEYGKGLFILLPLKRSIHEFEFDDRINLYHDLSDLYERTGQMDSCIQYARILSTELKSNIIDRNFQLVESGFENYEQVNRYFEYMDRIVNRSPQKNGPMIDLAADNVLFRKSIYLNSSVRGLQATDSATRKQQLIKNKQVLFKEVTWRSVQKQLSPKSAVVEFVSYAYDTEFSFFYAIIIRPTGDPVLVSYPQNDTLYRWLDHFDGEKSTVTRFYGFRKGEGLYEWLWAPLTEHLKGMEEVFISPDGALHKVNFSAIVGPDDSMLGERYHIRRILSSRFLTETNQQRPITYTSLFGGIDYEADSTIARKNKKGTATSVLIRSSTGDQVNWNYLEGTQVECQKIQHICRAARLNTRLYQGKEATESAFYEQAQLSEGYILHVATHGFTDLNMVRQNKESRGLILDKEKKSTTSDPLLRTGIVFAGANKERKYPVVSPTDGIALGAEIAMQSFDNCELVVLSACETGLGEVKGKEGVFGLQKAFKQSGAKKIIASLWQVPDKQTAELFTLFYENLFSLRSVSQALRAAQREMRKKYDPYYWAGFILLE